MLKLHIVAHILVLLWSNHTKRMRKRRRFIGYIVFLVYLPCQAKAKAMSSDFAFQLNSVPI